MLSKGFFLSSLLGGAVLFFLLLFVGFMAIAATEGMLPGVLLIMLAFLALIYSGVIMAILVYKMWKAIQDGHARTTPGKAAGFLFIPFFNYYWIFQAIWGFSVDYNAYIERHSIAVNRLPTGLFLTYAILHVSSIVPYLGTVTCLAALIIFIILIIQICNAVNALQNVTLVEPASTTDIMQA